VPRSQTERLWLIGGALVGFVLILIGYFFFISPQRSKTSDVNAQASGARDQNTQLQSRIDALRAQNKNLGKYQAELASAQKALPSTSGVSDFVRSLQALGNATLTNVTTLSVGQPAPVVAPAPAAATPTDGSSSSSAPAPAATPTAPPAPSAYSLAITATVSGSPTGLDKFLDQLQNVQPRAVLITQITESSAALGAGGVAAGSATTLQLTMQAFVAQTAAAAPAATPTTAAGN
jgi:hypothetical protein